ncbi:hypothetical protein [uncultured Sphingomonas sp.]|uniref:hypothetical protein n=1 Tax=uncultured Sphingomonas sp. TaxID=158754 RepID=UPI00345BB223
MSTAWRITDAVPGRNLEFRRRTLDRGGAIGLHVLAHDEVCYVLSEEGEVENDGVRRRLGPGMTAYLYDGAKCRHPPVGRDAFVADRGLSAEGAR